MISDNRIASWLETSLNLKEGLSYSERKRLEDGEIEPFVRLKVNRLNAKIKLVKFSSGAMCVVLLLMGLYLLGVGYGLIPASESLSSSARSEGLILTISASAIMTIYRAFRDVRLCERAETALELDRHLRG